MLEELSEMDALQRTFSLVLLLYRRLSLVLLCCVVFSFLVLSCLVLFCLVFFLSYVFYLVSGNKDQDKNLCRFAFSCVILCFAVLSRLFCLVFACLVLSFSSCLVSCHFVWYCLV